MKWIRTERPILLPPEVREVIQALDDEGYVAYVVGGCVRDFLLGRTLKDYDLATNATPDEVCALFPDAITVGKAFGVVKVAREGRLIEIATFRRDLEYKDARHPTGVEFSGPVEDALRRDFTINALFFDPKTSRILDVVEGMEDLKRGVLRAIGDPHKRFQEDALRLLRAIRFASVLGFPIEAKTWEAIQARARGISRVSPERVRDELNAAWVGPRPAEALHLLHESGLIHHLLPELLGLRGLKQTPLYGSQADVWGHTLKSLQLLARFYPGRTALLSWATLLHEIGKPVANRKNFGRNFNGYDIEGGAIARSIADRFRFPKVEVEALRRLVEEQLKFRDLFKMRESRIERMIREPHFGEQLALHHVQAIATDGNLATHEYAKSRWEATLREAPQIPRLLDGNDLIQMGFRPGPEFTSILRTVEDLALEKKFASKEEALEYVVRHFVR